MKAMVLDRICDLSRQPRPLSLRQLPDPRPGAGELLLQVLACGVCHTELDEIEGRTPPPRLPVVLGHQVVGRVVELGQGTTGPTVGDRVGVAWIYRSCGACAACQAGDDNLCQRFEATGRDADGGYAELMRAPADAVFAIGGSISDAEAAPLLCAGAIGYRSLRLSRLRSGQRLGLTGFGASAHLVLKLARHQHPGCEVFVFARSPAEREFALQLGAAWAGDTDQRCPAALHAVIDTTPAWRPAVQALANLAPGGRLVINAIRKEDADKDALLELDYPTHLWLEKEIKSVANVARRDVREFLALAAQMGIQPEVQLYPLEQANQALLELKQRKIRGAKVLMVSP